MASFAKLVFYLSLLAFLSSHAIEARESQFFSKTPSVNSNRDDETLAEKIQRLKGEPVYKSDQPQEPEFIPETKNGGFGLYGKARVDRAGIIDAKTLKATTTPDAYLPYFPYNEKTKEKEYLPRKYDSKAYVTDSDAYRGNSRQEKDNKRYNTAEDVNYNTDIEEELNDFRFAQKGVNTIGGNINGNYYDGEDVKALDKRDSSDAKFYENGKYIYDNNVEKIERDNYGNAGEFGQNKYDSQENGYGYKNSFDWDNNKAQFEDFKFEEGIP